MVANFRGSGDQRENLLRGGPADGRGNGNGRGRVVVGYRADDHLGGIPSDNTPTLSSRWKKPVARVIALEDPLAELLPLVESSRSDTVILASLSSVCVLDTAELLDTAAKAAGKVIKISVSRTPIEMYAAGRETVASLLRSALHRRTDRKPLRESLFAAALLPSIDLLEEVPGEILFQNDLMEYFHNNLWVIGNARPTATERPSHGSLSLPKKSIESHITEKGCPQFLARFGRRGRR